MPWIRIDCSTEDDAWIQSLEPDERWAWIMFLARVKSHGSRGRVRMTDPEWLAQRWVLPKDAVQRMLQKAGQKIKEANGVWYVTNWSRYQDEHGSVVPESIDKSSDSGFPAEAIIPDKASNGATLPHPTPPHSTHGVCEFETFWKQYPNRQGKKNALRHFKATVKNPEDFENLRRAMKNYLESGNVKRGFVKNGSTWFNEWIDWIEPSEIMMRGNTDMGNRSSPPIVKRKKPEGNWREQIISCSNCGKEHKASETCKMEADK